MNVNFMKIFWRIIIAARITKDLRNKLLLVNVNNEVAIV